MMHWGIFFLFFYLAMPFSPLKAVNFYPNPGIIAKRNGLWAGSDHLFNLESPIAVSAEILKGEQVPAIVTNEEVISWVEEVLKKGGIAIGSGEGKVPLPFFHMLLMLYPIENGVIAYCEGRLFEEVSIERAHLPSEAFFQAITWENQSITITATDLLAVQLKKTVQEIVQTFADRFQFYEELKKKREHATENQPMASEQ